MVYADHRANAVFLRRDSEGHTVGASPRGTLPGSRFQGLAPGTQREAGHFSYTVGELRPYEVPQYVITESPIDAMSTHALTHNDGSLVTFVSTDGSGDLPRRQIEEGLTRGALARCAVVVERAGEHQWTKVQGARGVPRRANHRARPPSHRYKGLERRLAQPPWHGPSRADKRP